MVGVCLTCGWTEVQQRHRCPEKTQIPHVVMREIPVTRWFWREPYNPDSPPQVLAYMKYRKHKPGRSKHTKKDTTDRETLQRLWASTKDPFYEISLEIRSLGKVRGTYAIGVRKRLDAEDRFHPTFTLRPSTLRTSAVAPNIQNVVSDRDAKNLANGFRACIIATPGIPGFAQGMTAEQLKEYV
jgi:DNA polymerase I-like protein with 3'-5' exonuclease and polymerase domains